MARENIVRICVKGRNTYEKWTLKQWVYEIKDLVEREYGVNIVVCDEESDSDLPILEINDKEVLIGLPGEEGYLIEIIKKVLDDLLGKRS
jgi:hypothetical protein